MGQENETGKAWRGQVGVLLRKAQKDPGAIPQVLTIREQESLSGATYSQGTHSGGRNGSRGFTSTSNATSSPPGEQLGRRLLTRVYQYC